jgi:tripartite-type tricarboxylate transporter receptor subunit TctC
MQSPFLPGIRQALLLVCAVMAPAAWAQAYPNKPVRVVVAFTAGGTTDLLARMIGQQLSERLKQQFMVDNKPGGGGNIGTEIVVRAAPDGYTLLINSVGPIAVNPTLFGKLGYNPQTDLVPIIHVADVPNVLVVNTALGVNSFEELLAYGHAHPGKLNYASTGVGTSAHLAGFMLSQRADLQATHIAYKGADALRDLLANRVQFMFATSPSVMQLINAGKLRALAVSSAKRSRALPNVPTMIEKGLPDFEASSWYAYFAPKGTPESIVALLNKTINEIIVMPNIEAQMIAEGAEPVGGTPAELGQFVQNETNKWRQIVRDSGAKAE